MNDQGSETIVKSNIDFDNRLWRDFFKVMHTRELVGEINIF